MYTELTENEVRLKELLHEMWKTQLDWQYALLDLLNYPEVDIHVRAIRVALNELETAVSLRKKLFMNDLLERAENGTPNTPN